MFNNVTMLGRITQDLELKSTPSGVSVLTFPIAVDRRYQTKGEERKSDFFNCVAWRNEAEFISKYWYKGRPILVEGELQNRSYVDKNGQTKWVTEIIVERATFTGDSKASGNGATSSAPPPRTAEDYRHPQGVPHNPQPAQQQFEEVEPPKDDDYPF